MSNAIPTPRERYLNDADFHAVVDTLVYVRRQQRWSYADIHAATELAEIIVREREVAELTGDSDGT